MTTLLKLLSLAGLLLTLIPAILVYSDTITFAEHKQWMIAGMCLWFFTAPFWMKEKSL